MTKLNQTKKKASVKATSRKSASVLSNERLQVRLIHGKGRGVFARKSIAKGELIELAAFLFVSAADYELLKKTDLIRFVYDLGRGDVAIGLGLASLFNHADEANAHYEINRRDKQIKISAENPIPAGQEITIDYGYHPADESTWSQEYVKFVELKARSKKKLKARSKKKLKARSKKKAESSQ